MHTDTCFLWKLSTVEFREFVEFECYWQWNSAMAQNDTAETGWSQLEIMQFLKYNFNHGTGELSYIFPVYPAMI